METKFDFNSQVCTSKVQSERLLALGLKKETADMHWYYTGELFGWQCSCQAYIEAVQDPFRIEDSKNGYILPAWSLHRLLRLIAISLNIFNGITIALPYDIPFDDCIERIEHLIKEGYMIGLRL